MPRSSKFPDLKIPKTNILDYLFPQDQEPSDTALWIDARDPSHSLSPKQCLRLVRRLGFGLHRLGIEEGDVALILTPNHIYVPVAYLGMVGYGAIFSGMNPIYTVGELAHQISITQAKLMFIHPSLHKVAFRAAAEGGIPRDRLFLFSDKMHPPIDGVQDWKTMIGTTEEGVSWQWKKVNPDETMTRVAALNFSSGTTGLPKGVCISHYNLISNVEQPIAISNFAREERWLGFLPLYHAYGQTYTILMAMKLSIPIQVVGSFQFEDFLRIIQDHKITRLQVVPPIMIMLNKRPEVSKYDLTSLKHIMCGAAPLSPELASAVSRKLNVRVTQAWGMTETTCAAMGVPAKGDSPAGSVGMLLPNTRVKLITEEGKEANIGEKGDMYVKGPQVTMGYWHNEEATKALFDKEGWLDTGDVSVMNKEEFFWIVDRKKELIKVNALQVSPAELEAVLLQHHDVLDAAVAGITLDNNEWPRAYVVLREEAQGFLSERDIQKWVKSRVPKHKRLEGGVVFVPIIPKLASGKIQRKVMREWTKRDAKAIEGGTRARL